MLSVSLVPQQLLVSIHSVSPSTLTSQDAEKMIANNPPEGAGITAARQCMALRYRKHINLSISKTSFNSIARVHMDGHKGLRRLPRMFTSCTQHENQHLSKTHFDSNIAGWCDQELSPESQLPKRHDVIAI